MEVKRSVALRRPIVSADGSGVVSHAGAEVLREAGSEQAGRRERQFDRRKCPRSPKLPGPRQRGQRARTENLLGDPNDHEAPVLVVS